MNARIAPRLIILLAMISSIGLSCRTSAPPPMGDTIDCEWAKPVGEPSQFTLGGQSIGTVSVAEPDECTPDSHYIELRGSGTRQLVLAQELPEGAKKCRKPPTEPDMCPQIQVDHFLTAVWQKLSNRGMMTVGAGLGPCGDPEGGYDDWKFSIGISDWERADDAARLIADEMEKWDIGNQVGLSVRNAYCGAPEEEETTQEP